MADEQVKQEGGETAVAETPVSSGPPSLAAARVDEGAARKALETSVQSKLDALDFTGEGTVDQPSEAAEKPEIPAEKPTEGESQSETKTEDEQDPPVTEIEEIAEEQPKVEEKTPSTGPTLPAAVVRSLKAYDWTDDDIARAMKSDPANFIIAAQKIHANRTAETAQWANLGRQTKAAQQQNTPSATQKTEAPAHIDPQSGLFRPLNVDQMVEKFGNEEIVREITAPVNEMIAQINMILPDLVNGVSTIRQSKQETLARQVDQFFGQKELEPYQTVYGKDFDTMDTDQTKARNQVLEMADALIAGAAQQNRKLSVTDALTMAHDHVSSGFKKETTRKEIKATVQKRSQSMTMKPSKSGTKPSGTPKNSGELEARTRSRLAAVFGA